MKTFIVTFSATAVMLVSLLILPAGVQAGSLGNLASSYTNQQLRSNPWQHHIAGSAALGAGGYMAQARRYTAQANWIAPYCSGFRTMAACYRAYGLSPR